ncbi:MAG: hypothetical protein ACOY9Y_09725 [Bacillota bacterium]
MSDNIKLGPCKLTYGTGQDALVIDKTIGGVTLSITPVLKAIQLDQFGESDYDDRIVGWKVCVTAPMAETDFDSIKSALTYLQEVSGAAKAKLVDRKLGTSMRGLAKQLTLHPLENPDADVSDDVTLFLAAPVNQVTLGYGFENERVLRVEFKAYPKAGADPGAKENFFCIGDPSAAA